MLRVGRKERKSMGNNDAKKLLRVRRMKKS